MTEYILYPRYEVHTDQERVMSNKAMRRTKASRLSELRNGLEQGEQTATTKKYFVVLPTAEAHHLCHPTGREVAMAQRVHTRIKQKIQVEGISDPLEVQRHLKHYVCHTLCSEQPPDRLDRAYYPELQDIHNHVNKAKRSIQLSLLDQENVALRIEQWKKESPAAKYAFRPFHKDQSDSEPDNPEQSLLWVHQEVWQQDLLLRYGNTITMIDATYKTTKYDLPLFLVCVKTNHGYCVVAEFISQNECAAAIQEALEVLKTWNPQWKPAFFMCDYSEAEISGIESSFPGTVVYICDFHREQAWERWVKDHKQGLTASDADLLLDLLRKFAWAPSATPDKDFVKDHHFQTAVDTMKQSLIWRQNKQVEQWLTQTWLPVAKVYRMPLVILIIT